MFCYSVGRDRQEGRPNGTLWGVEYKDNTPVILKDGPTIALWAVKCM